MIDLSTYTHHISSILKVLVYIEDHLDEELSLEKMAKLAHISPYYFHKLFRAYMKETLGDYVKRLRLERAQERLRYTDSPITEIAFDMGYESPSSFTKVFNQVMGQSPSKYRKIMQPVVKSIMERTMPGSKTLQAEYVQRTDETVLFVRKVGDYNDTPTAAFDQLVNFVKAEKIPLEQIKTYYSIALDDPQIVERSKCRFDACVALRVNHPPKGEVGQKVIRGGRCAVFTYKGPYSNLEAAFVDIFRFWYASSNEELAYDPPFCEHINAWDDSIPQEERVTKLYMPLIKK